MRRDPNEGANGWLFVILGVVLLAIGLVWAILRFL